MKKARIIFKRKNIFILLLLLFALIFNSCSSKGVSKSTAPSAASDVDYSYEERGSSIGFGGYYDESANQAAAPAEAPQSDPAGEAKPEYTSSSKNNTGIMDQRKIIMEGDVSIETKDFDESIEALDQLIEDYEGFAESRTVRGRSPNSRALRHAIYTIRVPSDKFEIVMQDMGSIGTVLESNSRGTDITDRYVDHETRIRALKVQEETLLDILEKSTKLEDVITLESRIAEVRYEIESIENTLRNYDRLLAYSRIDIHIQEVDDATESAPVARTLGDKISGAFNQSIKDFRLALEDLIVWFAGSWIALIFYGIVIFIGVKIIMNARRKHASKNKSNNGTDKKNIKQELSVKIGEALKENKAEQEDSNDK